MTRAQHADALFDYWATDRRFEAAVDSFPWEPLDGVSRKRGTAGEEQEVCEQLLAEVWGYA